MSGGGGSTTAEIGGGLLAAGAIASMVMTGGADAPLAGAALEGDSALMGGDAALGTVDAAGNIVGGGAAGASVGSGLAGADAGITAGDVAATGSGINTLSALDNNLAPQYMSDISSPSSQYAAQDMENGINAGTGTGSTIASNTVAPSVPTSSSMDQAMAQDLENGANSGTGTGSTTPWYQSAWNAVTNNPDSSMYNPKGMNLAQKGLLGGAGIATLLAMQKSGAMKPNYLPNYNPTTAASMGLGRTMASNYAPQRNAMYNAGYAAGGNISTPTNVMPSDLQKSSAMPAQVQDLMNQYGISDQQASQGIQSLMGNKSTSTFSQGGVPHLKEGSFIVPADVVSHFGNGSTDAGLQALHKHLGATPIMGHGDGMSDDIHTSIEGKQPARVANGEAIVDPDRVKALGQGSSDVGAKKLYAMMDKVRKARTGSTKQGKQIKADKYLPA